MFSFKTKKKKNPKFVFSVKSITTNGITFLIFYKDSDFHLKLNNLHCISRQQKVHEQIFTCNDFLHYWGFFDKTMCRTSSGSFSGSVKISVFVLRYFKELRTTGRRSTRVQCCSIHKIVDL
jgi:hypothetical protein